MATENDKVNTGALTTLVLVGVFATLTVALSVTALVRHSVDGVASERQTLAQEEVRALRQSQADKLVASPSWTDKGKGLVSIPIDRAKAKVLADLARDPMSASPPPPAPTAPPEAAQGAAAPQGEGAQTAPAGTTAAAEPTPAAPARAVAAVKPPTPAAAPAPAPAPAPAAPAPKPTDG